MVYIGGLLLAVGGPISVVSTSDLVAGARKRLASPPPVATPVQQQTAPAAAASGVASNGYANPLAQPLAIGSDTSALDTGPLPSLAEVLRFDVTVEWVMRRWPRVTTGLPYMQLQGYRVPLVTGTGMSDVAGSLTYYFNARQQVQRITLRGTTGDPSVLATILTNQHGFTRRLTNDPSVVLYEAVNSSNKPAGALQIRSARVITASQPHMRFEVDLAMDRAE